MLFRSLALAAALLWPCTAAPEGALAVGQPADPKQGFSYGVSWDYATPDEARERALARCREQGAPEPARALCKVIRAFTKQCVAVALDPKAGTPGAGWAIATTREAAEADATRNCQAAAGRSRQRYCKVISSRCDGGGEQSRPG